MTATPPEPAPPTPVEPTTTVEPHPAVPWLLRAMIVAFPIVLVLALVGINAQDTAGVYFTPENVGSAYDWAHRFDTATTVVTLLGLATAIGVGMWIRANRRPIPRVPTVLAVLGILFVRGGYAAGWLWTLALAIAAVMVLRLMGRSVRPG